MSLPAPSQLHVHLDAYAHNLGVVRNYLDWLLSIPWGKGKQKKIDVVLAVKFINEDHYGLD